MARRSVFRLSTFRRPVANSRRRRGCGCPPRDERSSRERWTMDTSCPSTYVVRDGRGCRCPPPTRDRRGCGERSSAPASRMSTSPSFPPAPSSAMASRAATRRVGAAGRRNLLRLGSPARSLRVHGGLGEESQGDADEAVTQDGADAYKGVIRSCRAVRRRRELLTSTKR